MQELQFCQRESLKVGHILMKDMGLVKTRRLATMHKQTTYAKAVVDKQRAKAGMTPPMCKDRRKGDVWSQRDVDARRAGAAGQLAR